MHVPELEVYRRFNLPLLYWPRVGDDPKDWKGPKGQKGWNDPKRVYDFQHYRPEQHNVGVFTGREIAPSKFLADTDFDKLNVHFARTFFPESAFTLTRPGKPLSHSLYTTPTPLKSRQQYLALSDNKPYLELRGAGFQTMLPPSLHTPPDIRVALLASGYRADGAELRGPRGWLGSMVQVEHRLKTLAKQRTAADAALTEALLPDDERATREAKHDEYRKTLKTMHIKNGADGRSLVAFTLDGDVFDVSEMTPLQRAAFGWFEATVWPATT